MSNYYEWPPRDGVEYLYPCKTGGQCGKEMYERMGFSWDDRNVRHGNISVTTIAKKFDIPQWRGSYKCCVSCHLPLNLAEAEKANRFLGYKLEDVKIDNDFLELLNGF